mmetsp:Transcript_11686/g.29540  ORF Transcript_11686/g.29540 Transcript_11686/m.29540 type:complete len:212 (-) Transcript_11686:304-939(-)
MPSSTSESSSSWSSSESEAASAAARSPPSSPSSAAPLFFLENLTNFSGISMYTASRSYMIPSKSLDIGAYSSVSFCPIFRRLRFFASSAATGSSPALTFFFRSEFACAGVGHGSGSMEIFVASRSPMPGTWTFQVLATVRSAVPRRYPKAATARFWFAEDSGGVMSSTRSARRKGCSTRQRTGLYLTMEMKRERLRISRLRYWPEGVMPER